MITTIMLKNESTIVTNKKSRYYV